MSHIMYLTLAGARSLTTADPGLSLRARQGHTPRFTQAGIEPSLRELMNDPLTHAVMRRDNVTAHDLSSVVAKARARIRAAQEGDAA